jgi:hypothetical protein
VRDRCYVCGAEDVEVKRFGRELNTGTKRDEEYALMCKYCSGTLAGNAWWFPGMYKEGEVCATIAKCANILEKAILAKLSDAS